MLVGGLDAKIAEIRQQLDEAKALRSAAEALRKEYADKIAGAEKDAAAMIEHARTEAEAAKASVSRRARPQSARAAPSVGAKRAARWKAVQARTPSPVLR